MKIGFIGLGKLGLPCALAIESKGHDVLGYDISMAVRHNIQEKKIPYQEEGLQELLNKTRLIVVEKIADLDECDIIFVAVQTPHELDYEGVTRLPDTRVDFDYRHLENACKAIPETNALIVIISTVLPGTMESRILPILKGKEVVYNPFFIAMGTTIHDFLNPEFVLIGSLSGYIRPTNAKLCSFYLTIHPPEIEGENNQYWCTIREAEMIKVSYNTYITTKIAIANIIGEMCHKLHINSDVVTEALCLGSERIISCKYMKSGMGDGGACHPRDNIALSWLSRNLNLSYDWYENIMIQREKHTEWQVSLIIEQHYKHPELPIVILGKDFKANTNIETGSPAILLGNILYEKGIEFKYDTDRHHPQQVPAIWFIATNHDRYKNTEFGKEDIVLDPWGIIKPGDFELIKIAR